MKNTLGLALAAMVTATAAQSSTVTISIVSEDLSPQWHAFTVTLDLDVFGPDFELGKISYWNDVNPTYEDLTIWDADGQRVIDGTHSYEFGSPSQYPTLEEQFPGVLNVYGISGTWEVCYGEDRDDCYTNFDHYARIEFDENGEGNIVSTTYDDLLEDLDIELMVSTTYVYDDPVIPVPLPAGGLLLVTGLFGLGAWRRISGAA